jgi:SAM-dependent methyltransferase
MPVNAAPPRIAIVERDIARPLYESIGGSYASTRRPDPRIAAAIRAALGDVRSVINIGAGAGSYEPADLDVLAVEPSTTMIAQRPPNAARAVQGTAERLPVADRSFDAALAILTVHHWPDRATAFDEIRRVARQRAVFFTWVPGIPFWLYEYFPGIPELDALRCPPIAEYTRLGPLTSDVVPIPHDCTDGFLGAYWRRPDAYLDSTVRANISALALLGQHEIDAGIARLSSDLASGRWRQLHGAVLKASEVDLGYRVIRVDLSDRI